MPTERLIAELQRHNDGKIVALAADGTPPSCPLRRGWAAVLAAHAADFAAMPHVLIVHEVADDPVWKAVLS